MRSKTAPTDTCSAGLGPPVSMRPWVVSRAWLVAICSGSVLLLGYYLMFFKARFRVLWGVAAAAGIDGGGLRPSEHPAARAPVGPQRGHPHPPRPAHPAADRAAPVRRGRWAAARRRVGPGGRGRLAGRPCGSGFRRLDGHSRPCLLDHGLRITACPLARAGLGPELACGQARVNRAGRSAQNQWPGIRQSIRSKKRTVMFEGEQSYGSSVGRPEELSGGILLALSACLPAGWGRSAGDPPDPGSRRAGPGLVSRRNSLADDGSRSVRDAG